MIEMKGVDLATQFRRIERKELLMESQLQTATESINSKMQMVRDYLED